MRESSISLRMAIVVKMDRGCLIKKENLIGLEPI